MTENTTATTRTIPEINAVDGFAPAEFTRSLPNDDGSTSLYMDVKYRLLWFRLHCPNGKANPEIIHIDDKCAVVCCKIYRDRTDPADQYIGKGYAQRFRSDEKYGDRFLEIAETAALGRALAAAGYGTQFCGASDLLTNVMADSPVDLGVKPDGKQSQPTEAPKGAQAPQPTPKPEKQQRVTTIEKPKASPKPSTVEDYLNSMTIEEAEKVVIDVGYNSGRTLGEVAIQKPRDLEWYVNHYNGRNFALKAAAILLLSRATSKAS